MSQLSLFENQWQNKANELLESLNDGLKGKEVYDAGNVIQINDKIVFAAHNKDRSVYNILDETGNIPPGFNACWRSFSHIRHELKI